MARSCLFCGGPANSKEHVFPDWMSAIVPGEGVMGHGRGDDAGTRVTWPSDGFNVLVRLVCGTCNHGWMSDLENSTKELLIPFILGSRNRVIAVPEQKRLALWGYKTAIMAALAYPEAERFVPAEDYRYLADHSKPPDGTWIWIGACAPDLDGKNYAAGFSRSQRLDFWGSDGSLMEGHGYRITFSVVSLVFEVMRDPHGGKVSREYDHGDIWSRIRPISGGEWPPQRWMTPNVVADLHNGTFRTK